MNFSEQMKQIRMDQKLTQEECAQKLHVTRQAISNWENDKNLPDIEMLLMISETFNVSLDELLKGDQKMTNLTEKIIQDGSENKRARYNMVTSIVGGLLIALGILLLLIKANSVEYIDADGFLHENFYLIPLGFLSMFMGMIAFLSVGVRTLIHHFKK